MANPVVRGCLRLVKHVYQQRTRADELRNSETYPRKMRQTIYVKSFIRTSLQAYLLTLALATTATLHAQTIQQIAVLDLPDAPLPQAPTQQPTQQPSQQPSQQPAQQPGQSSSQPPQDDKQTEQEKKKEQHDAAEQELKIEEHQRIAGVMPNFNAVLDGSTVPLSAGQKIRASFRAAIDPYQFVLAGVVAGYGQATDSHSSIDSTGFRHGYEQGWIGYAKRYGSSFADQFDGTILGNGVFPAVLHQDARYFRLGKGKVSHRFVYALASTVRCKSDSGKWQPNFLGNLAAGGISNVYYPAADRGFGLTVEQALVVTAEGAFGGLLVEFYPDIQKHVFHKKDTTPTATTLTANP
jgi:flagellar motor protein MotB